MQNLRKSWTWIKENFAFLLVIGMFAIYVWANASMIQSSVGHQEEQVACKTFCFPQQSEYITHGNSSACWCYTNQTTMNKAE